MTDLLDSSIRKKIVHDGFANFMDRVRHFYIDGIIVLIVAFTIRSLVLDRSYFNSGEKDQNIAIAITFLIYALYYTLLEYFVGFTLGKLLNKTRIISLEGTKPSFFQIILRTISRLIPFGFMALLTPYQAALHDLLSKTRMVRIKKKYVVDVNEL